MLLIGGRFDGRRIAWTVDEQGDYIRIPVRRRLAELPPISSAAEEQLKMDIEGYRACQVHSRKHGRQYVAVSTNMDPEDVMALLIEGYRPEKAHDGR